MLEVNTSLSPAEVGEADSVKSRQSPDSDFEMILIQLPEVRSEDCDDN